MDFYTIRKLLLSIITHPVRFLKVIRQIDSWAENNKKNPKALVVENPGLWARRCKIMLTAHMRNAHCSQVLRQTIESFYTAHIACLKEFGKPPQENKTILITAVKNEKSRLNHFMDHYRGIGIGHFVFIDNGSDDGTVEKILEQEDTACYQTHYDFSARSKAGWFNRLVAHYGTGRWYIIVDSDEHFAYPGMSGLNIEQYVNKVQSKGYSCVKTVMLDMYPAGTLMDESKSDEEYLDGCIYFDRGDLQGDNDVYAFDAGNNTVSGGMRARLFHKETGTNLTKPTLLNYKQVYWVSTHECFPANVYKASPVAGAVLHFKFLPSDRKKYRERAESGKYFGGSLMYKEINAKMEQTPNISAMSELSVKFNPDSFTQYLPFVPRK